MNFARNFSANGLNTARARSKLIANSNQEVEYSNGGYNCKIRHALSPKSLGKNEELEYINLTMKKQGIQIDDRKSTPAKTITKREPGRPDTLAEAKCFMTKAFPTVPTSILRE